MGPNDLLLVLQSALVVERQVIGWFSVKHPDPECCTPSGKFPVFLLQDEEDFWYGFPQFGHNGLKIGKFDRENNTVSHPSQLDRRVLPQDEEVNSAFLDGTFEYTKMLRTVQLALHCHCWLLCRAVVWYLASAGYLSSAGYLDRLVTRHLQILIALGQRHSLLHVQTTEYLSAAP